MKISPRLAVTLVFIAFGVSMGSQIGAIPALRDQAAMDPFYFGLATAIGSVGNILGLSFSGLINRRFDHRSVLLFIMPAIVIILAVNLMTQSVYSYAVTFLLFAFSYGINDIFMNAEASVVEQHMKKPVYASFHAAVIVGIGLFGLVGSYIAVTYGTFWVVLPAIPAVALACVAVDEAIPHRPVAKQNQAAKVALPFRVLTLIGAIIGFCVAAELACISWAGQLLADKQPSLAAYSGLGVAFYGLCCGTARLMGDFLRARFADMTLVIVSFAIAIAGLVVLATNPGFSISVAAFAVAGLGLGLIFPCLFSVAAALVPEARAAALSHVSMISGPARIAMPFALGWVAKTYGLSTIYSVVAATSILAIITSIWTAREITKTKRAEVSPRPGTVLAKTS